MRVFALHVSPGRVFACPFVNPDAHMSVQVRVRVGVPNARDYATVAPADSVPVTASLQDVVAIVQRSLRNTGIRNAQLKVFVPEMGVFTSLPLPLPGDAPAGIDEFLDVEGSSILLYAIPTVPIRVMSSSRRVLAQLHFPKLVTGVDLRLALHHHFLYGGSTPAWVTTVALHTEGPSGPANTFVRLDSPFPVKPTGLTMSDSFIVWFKDEHKRRAGKLALAKGEVGRTHPVLGSRDLAKHIASFMGGRRARGRVTGT